MPSYEHLKVPVWRLGHDEVHVGHFVLGFADFLRCFGAHSFKTTKIVSALSRIKFLRKFQRKDDKN